MTQHDPRVIFSEFPNPHEEAQHSCLDCGDPVRHPGEKLCARCDICDMLNGRELRDNSFKASERILKVIREAVREIYSDLENLRDHLYPYHKHDTAEQIREALGEIIERRRL